MAKKQKTNKKLKLSIPKTKSHPSNPHFICDKEVVIQVERLSDSVVAEMTAGGSALPPEQTKKRIKLSTQKTRSHPSNPHFVCDKEVVIQLERLSDSVVAEMTAGGSALPPEQVYESNDDDLGINSLPDEVILEIFGYLKQNQLAQIARVCRKWNFLTKSPVLWKKVNAKIFFPSDGSKIMIVKSFINGLPSCVTSIRLDFVEYYDRTKSLNSLDFEEICLVLQEKCPNLEELILIHSVLSDSLPAVINICTQFLQHVKNLVFIECIFPDYSARGEYFGISKIEILGLFYCYCSNKPPFSKMPHLKQLNLRGTTVEDTWFLNDAPFLNQLQVLNVGRTNIRIFPLIKNHGLNLKELYLCSHLLQDCDLNFNDSAFPQLKTICLVQTRVTCEGVISLIQSCPSLENVYVKKDVAESFAAHPFVVANRCKSGVVKAIEEMHKHNVDYSCIELDLL